MSTAADALGLPPGIRFDPTPEELLEFYLVPRAMGQPPAVAGIILDGDEATTSSRLHPWNVLRNNKRTGDDEAYFFEPIASGGGDDDDDANNRGGAGAARQNRSCGDEQWTWVGQKRKPDGVLPLPLPGGGGEQEQVSWGKYTLNLHEGRVKGGSTGWVMHEYTVALPQRRPCTVKLCHVAFTGHGQKRQRVPQELEAGMPQQKRVATASSVATAAATTTTEQNQEQSFPNYEASSSAGNFWGIDAGFCQESSIGFSHESSIGSSQESAITFLDPWYPDAGASHLEQPFLLDQELAQNQDYFSIQPPAYHHQEQFVNHGAPSAEAFYPMLFASGLGSSHVQEPEPLSGQPLTKEEQLHLQLDQLFGGISTQQHCTPVEPVSAGADAYRVENIETTGPAATADLPRPVYQESYTMEQTHGDMDNNDDFFEGGWSDLDTFTDTSGVQDYDDGFGMAAGTPAGDGPGDGICYDGGNGNFTVRTIGVA